MGIQKTSRRHNQKIKTTSRQIRFKKESAGTRKLSSVGYGGATQKDT